MNLDLELWDAFSDIHFDEETHKYTDSVGTNYDTSVTGWVKQFSQPVDWDSKAASVAKREGVTKEEIKSRWKASGDYAANLGTQVHAVMEYLWKRKRYDANPPRCTSTYIQRVLSLLPDNLLELCDGLDEELRMVMELARKPVYDPMLEERVRNGMNVYSKLKDRYVPVREEFIVCDKELRMCGTIDFLGYDRLKDHYVILDYKTNKELKTEAYNGAKMLAPFGDLPDCDWGHYSTQLSVYKFLIERHTSLKIGAMTLIWIGPDGKAASYDCADVSSRILAARQAQLKC